MFKKILLSYVISISLLYFLFCYTSTTVYGIYSSQSEEKMLHDHIQGIFNEKNKVFFSGDFSNFKNYYELNTKTAQYCLEHEISRFMYLRDWAGERGIKFTEISSFPIVKKIEHSNGYLKVRIDEEYKFKYAYLNDNNSTENIFGVALFHHMKFKKVNNIWKIHNDYYLDCFEDALKVYKPDIKKTVLSEPKKQIYDLTKFKKQNYELPYEYKKNSYNRRKAIEYADRYCGVTWTTNYTKPKYNKKYKNFTGVGGNCTNYVSQCLGDKEGGNLIHGGGWHAILSNNVYECSTAWVNADAFKNYLLYSGKGRLIKRGSFEKLTKQSEELPNGYIGEIFLGDIISYEKKNDIDHNSIITNFDSQGYPMINSHTVERYHVPFDLGWGDQGINFNLIHITK